jgi:alpha-beta hydrolase superfamily lysophospholipase
MIEHIERYEAFALYLNSLNILVTGNDHLGHGGSISSKDDYGYFADENGNDALLKDMHHLAKITRGQYPDIPYFLLGHSMGSFYARQYVCIYGDELDGAVIMGTGFQALPIIRFGKTLCRCLAAVKGWHYRSRLVEAAAFGSYNQRFQPARTTRDWLTKDTAIVDAYLADERCTFLFTLNAYYNMFCGLERLHDKRFLAQAPQSLPLFFVSGTDDPVGEYTKGVLRAVDSCRMVGMKKIELKLYPGDRHELLNETDKQEVYQDIVRWMEMILSPADQ